MVRAYKRPFARETYLSACCWTSARYCRSLLNLLSISVSSALGLLPVNCWSCLLAFICWLWCWCFQVANSLFPPLSKWIWQKTCNQNQSKIYLDWVMATIVYCYYFHIPAYFGLGDKYYGSPVLSNPYLHVSTLTAESVRAEWTKVLKYFAHPVTIAANERSDFKDVKSALTTARVKRASATPKVAVPSVTQIASRFVVDVKKHKKDAENGFDLPPLAVFFKPALTAIEGTDLEQLIREIHSNLLCLFSVASMHYQAMKDDELTGHYELTNEQVLFTNILKAFVGSLTSPCVIHSQCMTEQNKTSKIMLPSAKFDLLVNTSSSGEPAESTIVVLVNGQAEEHAELVVSNKTNRTMKHKKLNVTVALEALIFAEVSRQEFTKIINASSRLVRPLMRLKSNDLLYTSSEALYWAYEDSGELRFNIPGCIILLLFLRAGLGAYPEYDPSDVFGTQHTQPASGWNEAYASLPDDAKYPRILKQTKPTLNRPTKLKVSEPETLIEGNPVDYVVQWRKRHQSE